MRTRLVAYYVFAAILLVIVATLGVTAFSLSTYGITARETVESAAHNAPDEARTQIARYGSLEKAAPDIVRHLVHPGLHVSVSRVDRSGARTTLARADADGADLRVVVISDKASADRHFGRGPFGDRGPPPPGGPPQGYGHGPPPPGLRGFDRGGPFPMGLNVFLHLEPRAVNIPGGRITIFPVAAQLDRFISAFWLAMLPIGIVVTLAAWLLGNFITGQALRPLVETTASLQRFADGDFTPRPVVTADRSEIGELVTAYNGAVAQVGAAFEERSKAEAQMRQFIADAGHELRTPLTVVMGFIDVMRRRGPGDPAASARIYETMLAESRRMRALINKLIALARLENPQQRENEPVDMSAVAQEVANALEALQPSSRVVLRAQPGTFVRGDRYDLHEAISNLVDNALKYAPDAPVEIDVRPDHDDAVVEVSDRGPGIGEAERGRIFDRFFRGENRGEAEGFGLGLAIVKRAVERAGGSVTVADRPGGGSVFAVRVPRMARSDDARIAV
ncbi:MAG: HAMP domain-containing histidine kinase [Candidatus Eremiobacteraeota bacterium]|nr:HAMP domain-containing histidine kinase [Candidatus Eremiobacteraeota bacterium]